MSVTAETKRDDLLDAGYAYRSGPPADWDYLIRSLVIWGLALIALLCGLVAAFSVFGRQREVENLSARTEQIAEELSYLRNVPSRIAILEQRPTPQDATAAGIDVIAAKVDHVERSFVNLSESVEREEARYNDRLGKIDNRVGIMDDKILHFQLRLSSLEAEKTSPTPRQSENGEQSTAAAHSTSPSPSPQSRLNRFSVLRADESGAWIVAPEGWFHVAAGGSLPGDVKVLEIEASSNHIIVHTDKGLIYTNQ